MNNIFYPNIMYILYHFKIIELYIFQYRTGYPTVQTVFFIRASFAENRRRNGQ